MTVKKKRIMQASALLVGSFVLAQTVLSEIPESTFAQQSFNGIESLIQSHNESDPYTVVELVPDASYAKLGYLVGGSEPFYYDEAAKSYQTYEEHLAALKNSADREEFSEEMKSTLSSITSASNPLTYEEYEESYVSQSGYTKLELVGHTETITAGTSEYYMQKVDGNTGDYQRQSKSDSATGEDDGNDVEEQTVEQQTAEQDEESEAQPTEASVEDTDEEPGAQPAAAIVEDSIEDPDEAPGMQPNEDPVEEPDEASGVQPNEDPVEDPDEASGVQSNEDPVEDPDEASGTQPAPAADEDGSYYYEYVGEGNGDYRLIKSEDGSRELDADVVVSEIYYQGGFTNNEWFKEYVFNQSGLLNAADTDISISVVALTPAQFAKYNGDMDLLYISGSSLLDTSNAQYYGVNNDLSASLADEIYTKVDSENTYLPVILDYDILQNSSIENTYIYKLVKRLIPQDLTMDNYAHGYVKGNVYVIPCNSADSSASFLNAFGSIFLDCSNVSGDEFAAKAAAIGFGDVADMIVSENTYRQVENNAGTGNTYDYFDQKLSEAIAVEYIISYASKREEYDLDTIQVLDIEPCTVSASTQETIEKNIRQYLQLAGVTDTENVVFTHMTSAEFISKVEDLCKYDMIYMGLYTDTLNTDQTTGRTVYNDSDMNGLVYTNIGDIQTDWVARGLLDTEYDTPFSHYSITNPELSKIMTYDSANMSYVRYSGNDFTDEKVKAIKNFVLSGSPVILEQNFLTEAGGTTYVYDFARNSDGSKNTSEQGYIDNCSKVYELIEYIKDYPNVIRENALSSDSDTQQHLLQYLTLGKPVLSVTTAAKESGQEYVKINGSVVSFDFSIENYGSADANATFDCVLYADYNSDGRYSNTTERIGANDFSITLNGVKQTVKSKTDEDGTIYYYELSPNTGGESYHLEYTVSSSYVGIIPVKIKVSQSGNDYRYASDEFYFFKARNTKEKLKIHVLQILSSTGNDMLNMGKKDEYDGKLEEYSAFYKYLNALEDYEISIVAMKSTTYAKAYEDDPSFLDDYDMLVLGFSDSYNFLEVNGSLNEAAAIEAYQGIKDFIASGKSVLFTHDTTSYGANPSNGTGDWGLVLNQLLTQDVGLDRYGVNESLLLKAGIKGLTEGGSTTYDVSDYQSLSLAYKSGILTKTSYTAGELFELIVKEAEENNKDIAYKPNSAKKTLVTEVQGRSSMTINGNKGWEFSYKDVNTNPQGTPDTNSVELLNEGQILIYPYNILDEIKANNNILNVATTHGQYFQIDMNEDADSDGESDITVWLSLTGNSSYDSAKKDARNNYYIYTKGNVTYSGVGHSYMNDERYASELKLYINTMVAAYQTGTHAPTLTLTDEDGSELNVIYVGVDSKLNASGQVEKETQIDQETEKVYVTVRDTNDVSAEYKQISVEYYLAYGSSEADLPAGVKSSDVVNIGTEADPIYAKKCDWTTYRTDGSVQDPENLTSGVKYYVNVPYNLVGQVQNGRAQVYVVATTRIWEEGENPSASEPSVTCKNSGSFYVQRLGLFDLE